MAVILYFLLRNTASSSGTGNTINRCNLDTDCTGTQVCNTNSGTCVECNLDGDCPLSRPLCNLNNNTCVGCVDSSDCTVSKPFCDSTSKICVGCQTSADCGGLTPICSDTTQTCVGCVSNGDCDLNNPYCNAASNQCAECLTNANCVLPAVCNFGRCCDQTMPNITSLIAQSCTDPDGLSVLITYTFTQNPMGLTAIFEVSDSTGFVLLTTAGVAATGTHVIKTPAQNTSAVLPIVFYAGYSYRVRVRLSQECGLTAYSNYAFVNIPFPSVPVPLPYVPVITSAISINTTSFRLTLNPPLYNVGAFDSFRMVAFIIPSASGSSLDPNRALTAPVSIPLPAPAPTDPTRIQVQWPLVVASGQSYYVRIMVNGGCGTGVVSNAIFVLIP